MIRRTSAFLLLISSLTATPLLAQLRVDTAYSPETLVSKILLGKGLEISNIRYLGDDLAIGRFSNDSTPHLFSDGVILSTGNIYTAPGPNKEPGTSSNTRGQESPILNALSKGRTYDAAVLSFNFTPSEPYVSFQFVFASEEYSEFVGKEFNDVFAFLIDGESLKGKRNIAVVPGTSTPITINNINQFTNEQYYIDNDRWDRRVLPRSGAFTNEYKWENRHQISFDGLTTVLTAECELVPGETYRMSIAIADVGDFAYNSAVFLGAHSFSSHINKEQAENDIVSSINLTDDSIPHPETLTNLESTIAVNKDSISNSIAFPIIYFDHDLAIVDKKYNQELTTLAAFLRSNPQAKIRLIGHTDSDGSDSYNERLSRKRANAVLQSLIKLGAKARQISTSGQSEHKPVAPNDTENGKGLNRRVMVERTNTST